MFKIIDLTVRTQNVLRHGDIIPVLLHGFAEKLVQIHELVSHIHEDYEFIYLMYSFPEKFWKISNRYMNTRKSYISPVLIGKTPKSYTKMTKKSSKF